MKGLVSNIVTKGSVAVALGTWTVAAVRVGSPWTFAVTFFAWVEVFDLWSGQFEDWHVERTKEQLAEAELRVLREAHDPGSLAEYMNDQGDTV